MTNPKLIVTPRQPARWPNVGRGLPVAVKLSVHLAMIVLFGISTQVSAESLNQENASVATVLSNARPWIVFKSNKEPHPLGIQTLSVEKQERKNQHAVRWVNVFQYNYDARSARRLVVDIDSNAVIQTSIINSVHLPLNDAEIAFSKELIEGDSELISLLKEDQVNRGVEPFETLNALGLKASIYEPIDIEHACTKQRCALVSLFDKTQTVLNIEPIVNLNSFAIERLGQ